MRRDIENLKAALAGSNAVDAFLPSVAPSGVGFNEYYSSEEQYFEAVGAAMREEYEAIVDAGFVLQIDDPFLTEIFSLPSLSAAERRRAAEMWVEALNHALAGIPPTDVIAMSDGLHAGELLQAIEMRLAALDAESGR